MDNLCYLLQFYGFYFHPPLFCCFKSMLILWLFLYLIILRTLLFHVALRTKKVGAAQILKTK